MIFKIFSNLYRKIKSMMTHNEKKTFIVFFSFMIMGGLLNAFEVSSWQEKALSRYLQQSYKCDFSFTFSNDIAPYIKNMIHAAKKVSEKQNNCYGVLLLDVWSETQREPIKSFVHIIRVFKALKLHRCKAMPGTVAKAEESGLFDHLFNKAECSKNHNFQYELSIFLRANADLINQRTSTYIERLRVLSDLPFALNKIIDVIERDGEEKENQVFYFLKLVQKNQMNVNDPRQIQEIKNLLHKLYNLSRDSELAAYCLAQFSENGFSSCLSSDSWFHVDMLTQSAKLGFEKAFLDLLDLTEQFIELEESTQDVVGKLLDRIIQTDFDFSKNFAKKRLKRLSSLLKQKFPNLLVAYNRIVIES